MAEPGTIDSDLIRNTALSVKALEKVADDRDYTNFLTPAKDLSDNVVKLVSQATSIGMTDFANDLRDKVKESMACAKLVLKEKSDPALEKFKGLLRQVAKVLVQLMVEMKKSRASVSVRYPTTNVTHPLERTKARNIYTTNEHHTNAHYNAHDGNG